MLKTQGIRFVAIINNRGRMISGGFSNNVTQLEKNEKKMEMLFMELALDLSLRSEFNNSLGTMRGVVSFRDKTNIITIPYGDDFMLVSSEPELDILKVIHMAYHNLSSSEIMEAMVN